MAAGRANGKPAWVSRGWLRKELAQIVFMQETKVCGVRGKVNRCKVNDSEGGIMQTKGMEWSYGPWEKWVGNGPLHLPWKEVMI